MYAVVMTRQHLFIVTLLLVLDFLSSRAIVRHIATSAFIFLMTYDLEIPFLSYDFILVKLQAQWWPFNMTLKFQLVAT